MDFVKQRKDCCYLSEWWEMLVPRADRPMKGSGEKFLQEKLQSGLEDA